MINELFAAGLEQDISSSDIHGATPLHYAAQTYNGDVTVLKNLLSKNAAAEATDKQQRNPLLWAASSGNALYNKRWMQKLRENVGCTLLKIN